MKSLFAFAVALFVAAGSVFAASQSEPIECTSHTEREKITIVCPKNTASVTVGTQTRAATPTAVVDSKVHRDMTRGAMFMSIVAMLVGVVVYFKFTKNIHAAAFAVLALSINLTATPFLGTTTLNFFIALAAGVAALAAAFAVFSSNKKEFGFLAAAHTILMLWVIPYI